MKEATVNIRNVLIDLESISFVILQKDEPDLEFQIEQAKIGFTNAANV